MRLRIAIACVAAKSLSFSLCRYYLFLSHRQSLLCLLEDAPKHGRSKLEDGNRTRAVFPNSATLLRAISLPPLGSIRVQRTARARNNEWLPSFHGSEFCGYRSLLARFVHLSSTFRSYRIFNRDFWIARARFKSLCYAATLYILMTRIRSVPMPTGYP